MPGDRLSPAALRLYAYAAERHSFTPKEATSEPALGGAESVEAALDELTALHLLQRTPGTTDRVSAVPPRSAAARALAPLEHELRRGQERMDLLKGQLEELVPLYQSGTKRRERDCSGALELITDLGAVRTTIAGLAQDCRGEILTAQPGGGRPRDALEEAIGRDETMLGRGVRMRTLYQHTARYDRPTAAYVERVTALGAQVRTLSDAPVRMLIFDRTTGLMAVPEEDLPGAALVVRDPNVVHFMAEAFERCWLTAEPYPAAPFGPEQAKALSEDLRRTIVQLLSEGVEDKVIARRLGMSDRTCQRHIAEIMRAIGARNRFQAGYLIREANGVRTGSSKRPAGPAPDDPRGPARGESEHRRPY
ncbi:LuxR C-terminal-related transcriptional regulator [Streptomyces sp. NPDC006879]|uniref:LuxR C-terminal-related transcriptional regulator n=1 Tax=Streptomyces sp. NPDC006879 TaxID=3364767 RepID=UPI0036CA5FE5